jgi:UDP-glucose 4-epimerase
VHILVTGGAGYVGSAVVEELIMAGYQVSVADNLQQGHRQAVLPEAAFIKADIRNPGEMDDLFKKQCPDAVVHMAAETVVEFSMTDPRRYFENNVQGGSVLLNTMLKYDVKQMIFSSTAAVYGEPETKSIDENHPLKPVNSYGESKLMFERILAWYGRAYGIKHISFRYFCAAGATGQLGEDHTPETHLIPNVLKSVINGKSLFVFGDDYPTDDGSCIRDFVHVSDIARGHTSALTKLQELSGSIYNLGNKQGYTVLQVIKAAEKVTGQSIKYQVAPRRSGDPAVLIANSDRARKELGWQPEFPTLEAMLDTAWQWFKGHPEGYAD